MTKLEFPYGKAPDDLIYDRISEASKRHNFTISHLSEMEVEVIDSIRKHKGGEALQEPRFQGHIELTPPELSFFLWGLLTLSKEARNPHRRGMARSMRRRILALVNIEEGEE